MNARALLAISREDLRGQLLATLAELQHEVDVIGVVETSNDLLITLDSTPDIDLVLMDEHIGSLPYLALTREVVTRTPDVGVVLLTSEPSMAFYQSAMDAGARAVVEAPPTVDDIAERLPSIREWQRQVRAMAGSSFAGNPESAGRLIAVTGAKGGVGTTTVALHLALMTAAADSERRVCLVDFDLQQRGVRQHIDVSARRTVADLVPVADSLAGRNLDEAVFVHQSGLRMLLAPHQGEQAEDVTGHVARQVLAGAKGHYDVVVVDCGSVVTEAGAVAMEFADDLLLVTTPDVPALRAAQDKMEMLSRLQIAKSTDVTLLFNKASSRNEVQPDFGGRMTGIETHRVALPEDWRRLEPVSNSLSPVELEDGPFRRALAALRRELRLEAVPSRQDRREHGLRTMGDEEPPGRPRGRRRSRRERGQVTIEAVVGLAVALGIFLVLMQTALMAMGTVASKRAADAAALVGSRGGSQAEAAEAARGKTPPFFDVEVSPVAGRSSEYRATLLVPSVVPFINRPLTSTAAAAEEE
jgi:pilus assembly protein CpaE